MSRRIRKAAMRICEKEGENKLCICVSLRGYLLYEPPYGKTKHLHWRKLISAFVFATRIVQILYFLNPQVPASIFCDCAVRFVSDLVGTQVFGFLAHRLIFKISGTKSAAMIVQAVLCRTWSKTKLLVFSCEVS